MEHISAPEARTRESLQLNPEETYKFGSQPEIERMKFVFSRHAKRRMKLYGIPETEIVSQLGGRLPQVAGTHVYVWSMESRPYPIKLVVALEAGILTIVTVYPLKKGQRP